MSTHFENVVQVKKFGDDHYKITILNNHNVGKLSEIQKEFRQHKKELHENEAKDNELQVDEKTKLAHSISRTKSMVLEKALCNPWCWFVTLTLDQSKYKRDDLDTFISDLSEFIRYQRKKTGLKISYLLIPELHADGINWHMHGLISALPESSLELHTLPTLRKMGYLNWPDYQKKFGFCSLAPIRDKVKCALYIVKYISKNFKTQRSVQQLHKKMYYCSQGLKKAEVVSEGILNKPVNIEMAFNGLYSKSTFIESFEWFKEYYTERELKDIEREEELNEIYKIVGIDNPDGIS